MEDELFTLNETGKAIWNLLDGKRNVREVATILSQEYELPVTEIEMDVVGLLKELLDRRMLSDRSEIR